MSALREETDLQPLPPDSLAAAPPGAPARARLAVGIATGGRAAVLAEVLVELERQTVQPDCIMICYSLKEDVAGIAPLPDRVLLQAPPSLTAKRNRLLDHAVDFDLMLFLDDDFLPQPDYIEHTVAVMQAQPDVVVATGHVIVDGSIGPGYTVEQGRAFLNRDRHDGPGIVAEARNGYGCNMTIRLQPARDHAVRFDERLPLYGYWEDLDYTRRLGRWGRIVTIPGARGVHLAVKSARVSGYRMGYSQVVNTIYLMRKGSMPLPRGVGMIGRHLLNNVLRSFNPENFIDRRGRMQGNLHGLADVLRGRIDPEHVLRL